MRKKRQGREGRKTISPSGPFDTTCCLYRTHSVLVSPARIPKKNSPFAHAFSRRKIHHTDPLWAPSPQYVGTKRHRHHQVSLQLPSVVLPLLPTGPRISKFPKPALPTPFSTICTLHFVTFWSPSLFLTPTPNSNSKTSIRPFTYLLYTVVGIRPSYRTLLLETSQLEKYNTKHIPKQPFSVTLLSTGTLTERVSTTVRSSLESCTVDCP
jgi:hypothetical protein